MNLRKWTHKLTAVFAAILLLAVTFAMPASADIFSGLEAAEGVVESGVMRLLTSVFIPLLMLVVGVVTIIIGIQLAIKYKQGEERGRLGWGLAGCIVALIVLGAFEVWGTSFFGIAVSSTV